MMRALSASVARRSASGRPRASIAAIGAGLPAEQRVQEATHYKNRFPGRPSLAVTLSSKT